MTAKQTWIIEMPEYWRPGDCYTCQMECQSFKGINPACPLSYVKKAVEVRFEIDHETGLSVIDKNNKFHFEGQDKYYAVGVEK